MWWIYNDLCGLFTAFLSLILLVYSWCVLYTLSPWLSAYSLAFFVYSLLTVMALASHSRAQFTDPGAVPRHLLPHIPSSFFDPRYKDNPTQAFGHLKVEDRPLLPRTCKRCRTVKPYSSHHCSTCGRCIVKLDHHCPWINNCVALFNQKYFLLFLLYTLACCIMTGVILVARFITCTNNLQLCDIGPGQTALAVVDFIVAVIFGLFIMVMLFDQLTAIFDNTPGIDALQHRPGMKKGRYASLIDVFGEPFSWRWFLPLAATTKILHDFKAELNREETQFLPAHTARALRSQPSSIDPSITNSRSNFTSSAASNIPTLADTIGTGDVHLDPTHQPQQHTLLREVDQLHSEDGNEDWSEVYEDEADELQFTGGDVDEREQHSLHERARLMKSDASLVKNNFLNTDHHS